MLAKPQSIIRASLTSLIGVCQLVDEHSATFDSVGVENIGMSVDHSGLNKFGSRTANYEEIFNKIVGMIRTDRSLSKDNVEARYEVIPFETVPSYTERPVLSTLLEERLRIFHDHWNPHHSLTIYGLGGAGKTQLVLHYVERHRIKYNPILWINAQNEDTTRDSFKAIFEELQLNVPANVDVTWQVPLKKSPTVKAVLNWLQKRDRNDPQWLVVVDGADDLTWGVRDVIPKGKKGSVILTSRDKDASELFSKGSDRLHVDSMEKRDALDLLFRGPQPLPEKFQECANGVVEKLDFLAFAVDLARANVAAASHPGQALCTYQVDLEIHREALLNDKSLLGLTYYEQTIMTVWDTTVDTIKKENENSIQLLAFIAQFGHTDFQDILFQVASFALSGSDANKDLLPKRLTDLMTIGPGGDWDSFNFRQAIRPLIRYSLLQPTTSSTDHWTGYRIHGLLRWWAKQSQEQDSLVYWSLHFIALACSLIHSHEYRSYRRQLIPNVRELHQMVQDSHVEATAVTLENGNEVPWNTVIRVFSDEGLWREAEELGNDIAEMNERVFGAEHPSTLRVLTILASMYKTQQRLYEAENLEIWIMKANEKIHGPSHPDTLTSMEDLALTYKTQQRWEEAEMLYTQVIDTRKTVSGFENVSTLISMRSLASTYSDEMRWGQAE